MRMCRPMTSPSPGLTINRKDCSCDKPDGAISSLSGMREGNDNGLGDGGRCISCSCIKREREKRPQTIME